MAMQKKTTALPRAEKISGTLQDLAVKYKGVADLGGKPVAGTLDDLAKKYHGAAEFDFSLPVVETIAGTLDDLAKKYHGLELTRPDIEGKGKR